MTPFRKKTALLIVLVTVMGLASKFAFHNHYLNNYLAGVWYVVFWILVGGWLFPGRRRAGTIALTVFLATSVLECLQLVNPPPLAWARSFLLGKILLGTSFAWWDFPHYLLGAAIGYGLLVGLQRR